MANKREFKKYVTAVSQDIITTMMTVCYSTDGVNHDIVDKAVATILVAGENAICKSNVKFDKTEGASEDAHAFHKAKRNFYRSLFKKVNKEFTDAINEAVKQFNAALPESVKAANKA